MAKRPPQPKPGEPGGVRWNYEGPIMYIDGQYYDPEVKRYLDLATGEHFDLEDSQAPAVSKQETQDTSAISQHFLLRAANSNHSNDGEEAIRDLREKLKERQNMKPRSWLSKLGLK